MPPLLLLPLKDDFVNISAFVNHARTVVDKDALVLAAADRVSICDNRPVLNEIVCEVGNKREQVFNIHRATIHFNVHQSKLAHSECVQPDVIIRSAHKLESEPYRYGDMLLRNIFAEFFKDRARELQTLALPQ